MFQEPTKNVPMAVSAIILLIIGVYAVSTSQSKAEVEAVPTGCVGTAMSADTGIEFITTVKGESSAVSNQSTQRSANRDNYDNSNNSNRTDSNSSEEGGILDQKCTEIPHSSGSSVYSVNVNPLSNNQNENREDVEAGIHRNTNTGQQSLLSGGEGCQKDSKVQCSAVVGSSSSHSDSNHCKALDGHIIDTRTCGTGASIGDNKSKRMLFLDNLKSSFGAYLLCFFVGFCDGTLLVPFKLGNIGQNSILSVFRYLASFGISSIMVSPVLFFFYCLFFNGRKIPSFHFHVAFIPGVSSGILWAAANFLSVHATFYLGNHFSCILVFGFTFHFNFFNFDSEHARTHLLLLFMTILNNEHFLLFRLLTWQMLKPLHRTLLFACLILTFFTFFTSYESLRLRSVRCIH